MFRVKICGVTTLDDARSVASAGADAIGLNFYPRSVRFIDRDRARQIAAMIPAGVMKVGVFVNASRDEIWEAVNQIGLDVVQLHGQESAELIRDLAPLQVIRAFQCGPDGLGPILTMLDECRRFGRIPAAVLLDAALGSQFGGTGTSADWTTARAYRNTPGVPPLILAGGLKPENVASAIAAVGPYGVDTASGVEFSPGHKDPVKSGDFVRNALQALG